MAAEVSGHPSPLEKYRLAAMPPSMYYIHNFITPEEEQASLQNIPASRWISLSHRRLQAVPTQLTAANVLLAAPLPRWLTDPIVQRFASLRLFEDAPHGVNHCLINEYLAGQGIMPHEDGPAYHPVVATVSLAGHTVLEVTEKKVSASDGESTVEPRKWRILQEPRSLLVTTDTAYRDTLHGIGSVREDADLNEGSIANWQLLGDRQMIEAADGRLERQTRISLTFRDVKKVSQVASKLFGRVRT